ncbi:hypothetical protein ON006_27265 [Dyadobacter pollutisoli]|uniref:Uncharacterized protein n=1 Tax=Dyadobacter pollutisoli TaxID=2910158 RepID=A0A9E8N7Q6_9BACT|nr:hypothetical protein [Dyadobacter pollutisoli]WAC11420.1 hypothetical protein ON006_27265 [Dyadobacter pollutisoli]
MKSRRTTHQRTTRLRTARLRTPSIAPMAEKFRSSCLKATLRPGSNISGRCTPATRSSLRSLGMILVGVTDSFLSGSLCFSSRMLGR